MNHLREARPEGVRVADIDFERDLVNIFQGQLVTAGYLPAAPPSTGACDLEHRHYRDDILYKWIHLRNRIPASRPRRVHKSREFRVSSESLAPELKAGLALIERKLVTGETIYHHLSRKIGELDFHDLLLDDWDIHHLHLGTSFDDKDKNQGLIEGTREVVYCIFKPDDVYIIQVMSHEFYDPELLEIVNANWPELLTRLSLHSARTPAGDVDPSTRASVKAARRSRSSIRSRESRRTARHHPSPARGSRDALSRYPQSLDKCPPITAPITLRDGTVLMPPGGGFATSGHSVSTRMAVINWKMKLQQWEVYMRGVLDRIIEQAQERGIAVPSRIGFQLRYDESAGRWVADSAELMITAELEPRENEERGGVASA